MPAAQALGSDTTGNMPLSLCSLQNGEEVRYEELSDAVHFEAHHVRLHQVAIITGKLPRLLLDEVCFFNINWRLEKQSKRFAWFFW